MNDHDFIIDMQARCAAQLANTTTPIIPPPIKPIDPPPVPVGAVTMIPAPAVGGTNQPRSYDAGVTYAFALPTTRNNVGTVSAGGEAGVGTGVHLEISFTKVPGDWGTAKAMAHVLASGRTEYPYYGEQGGYVSLVWGPAAASPSWGGVAVIPTGEQWYCNLRSSLSGYLTVQIPQQ